ncbi:MAG: LacI family DNA-binding transcriptional regulator [Kiritimatiellia bacterium]
MMKNKKLSTIADVAEKAGVSTATVSRMINDIGPISEITRERVRDAIQELNYSPRRKRRGSGGSAGNAKSAGKTLAFLRIGSFVTNDRHPVTEHLIEALHASAHAMGHKLTVHHVPDLKTCSVQDVIGDAKGVMIRASNEQEVIQQSAKWLGNVPAVQVLGENRSGRLWLDHVTPDNAQVGALAAEYLMEQGCDRLIFAATNLYCGVGVERCVAFVNTACEAGKNVQVVVETMQGSEKYFQQGLSGHEVECHVTRNRMEMIKKITSAKQKRFGLFVPTDLELAMVMTQLQLLGVDFGKSARAIGCDHETRCLSGLDPMPATLDLHLGNIAERAIRRVTHRIEHPDQPLVRISVSPTLVHPRDVMNPRDPVDSFPPDEIASR